MRSSPSFYRSPRALVAANLSRTAGAIFLALLVSIPSPALDSAKTLTQYAHRIWGQEEGLFQPTIYSILQTRDGFLWLGTQDSLIRFDGLHFREFAGTQSLLHGSLIRALLEDKQGNLWVGSIGSGLTRISRSGQIKKYSARDGVPSDKIFCLAPAGNSLLACTDAGLVSLNSSKVQTFTTSDGLPSDHIRAACQATDGTIWAAGIDFGLSRMAGGRFSAYSDPHIAPQERVNALLCASDNSVWAGRSSGLVKITAAGSKVLTAADGLPDNEVLALTETAGGTLWIGTSDGITRFEGGELSVYRTRDGLSHSQVLSLFTDREGTLWAGTKDGLDQFTDGKLTPYTTAEGLNSNNVGPVLEDRKNRLWIGTLDAGLNYFDGRRFHSLSRRDGLVSNSVLSLALDHEGDIWVGTGRGISRVRDGRVIESFTTQDGLAGSEVRSLFVDAEDMLWAGTDRGLSRFDGRRFNRPASLSTPDNEAVVALSGGRKVRLFASVQGPGLHVLKDGRLSSYSLGNANPVDSFWVDPVRHTVWMATLGSGLVRWKDGVISHVHLRDGLYDNRIYSILQDDASHFWLASSKGIFRLNQQELEDLADGKRSNVSSLPFSTGQLRFECRAGVQPAACRTHDGRLWFATTTGLVVIDPGRLLRNKTAPPVSITAVIVNGRRFEPPLASLRLKPWQTNNVEIHYAGLSFVSPEKVLFRYMLAGYDSAWIDAGNRREAFYTNLPPGNFKFRVQARNADGIWSTASASFGFTVEPRLYQRWWFFPALVLALALAVAIGFRIRIRRLRKRFDLVLSERNRIARELHDTLLQGLAGITMQLQALWTRLPASKEKAFLGEIIHDAGLCATEARQSLWGLRQAHPASPDFSRKITDLVRSAVSGKLALSVDTEPISLSELPDAEYQLLRIAQEATANAIKHASATHLLLYARLQSSCLVVKIEDDGTGSSAFSPGLGHYGLQGMHERAAEIGAELSITSSPQGGTAVCITLPLPIAASITSESNPQDAEVHLIR